MNSFLDHPLLAAAFTVGSPMLVWMLFHRTANRHRLLENVRRDTQAETRRAFRVGLVLRQAAVVGYLPLLAVVWFPFGSTGDTLGFIGVVAVGVWTWVRAGMSTPPQALMPSWFMSNPDDWHAPRAGE